MRRLPATFVIGGVAIAAVALAVLVIGWRASRSTIDAGVWWDGSSFELSAADAAALGGPLSPDELARVQTVAHAEVERAFSGLRVNVTDHRDAFWHVAVVNAPITTRRNATTYPFSAAGESHVFGPLGGAGSVSFVLLAHNAIVYAPAGATRPAIVDAIGRGIGRAAVHELAHQALGSANVANIDTRDDPGSYEYANADRPSQYYGELRWTTAWPVLYAKFGNGNPR